MLRQLEDPGLLAGRTAVLSVGSNRAPVQLRRKFGDTAVVPVTPAILHDCDIVHAATISYYGAVSCTAHPSAGTDVMLNIAWLDPDQLQIMHRTEALGIAYDYVRMFAGLCGASSGTTAAGGEIVKASEPVFGYSARSGVLDVGGGWPAEAGPHSCTQPQDSRPCRGTRRLESFMPWRARPPGTISGATPASLADFIKTVVDDESWRQEISPAIFSPAPYMAKGRGGCSL